MKLQELQINESFLTDPELIHAWLNKNVHTMAYSNEDDDPMKGRYSLSNGKVNVPNIAVDISERKLTSLPVQFGTVEKDFIIMDNQLTSLKGCPKHVTGSFDARNNMLSTLEFMPKYILEDCTIGNQNGRLTSLKNIHKYTDSIDGYLGIQDIKSNMLGILKIDNPPEKVYLTDNDMKLSNVCRIINKHLIIIHGMKDDKIRNQIILECQQELLDHDLDEYAEM